MSNERVTKPIHDLKMHEATFVGAMEVLRVPGGWLYTWVIDSKKRLAMTTTFVPYHEEVNDEQ